ncbi:aspartate/glutamate racemase family protein [Demequina sp.]|uniref:aspartate/glutamate racemase family protein n=1 Tax=Demequina sp. TaxID=2050685 RepID=UPI003D0E39B6
MRTQPKKLGLLGGITWHSSIDYERALNEGVNEQLGGNSSADLIVRSYDFQQIATAQSTGDWDGLAATFANDARSLEAAGAQALLICANTMHLVAPQVQAAVSIPLIHMLDVTADAIAKAGLTTVALLGTGYTMRMPFYRDHMAARGIEVIAPDEPDLTAVHDLIYEELARGIIRDEGRDLVLGVTERLLDRGAQGVIACCTEIPLVVTQHDLDVPYFDTVQLHVAAALTFALDD